MKETKTKIWPWVNQKKMREREKMIMQTIEMILESENLSSNVTSELWDFRLINRDLSSIIDNNDKLTWALFCINSILQYSEENQV